MHIRNTNTSFAGINESSIDLLEFEDLPDEEVSVSSCHFRIRDVNHVFVDVKIDLKIKKKKKRIRLIVANDDLRQFDGMTSMRILGKVAEV